VTGDFLRAIIEGLRDNCFGKLEDLHDDHVHTRTLWRSVQVRVQRHGARLRVQNPVTNHVVDGPQLAGKARRSVQRLKERSFKDIVAQFELFVTALLRAWLPVHPELLAEKALTVATLLASKSLLEAQGAAIREAVEDTIADKMYGRLEKWFNYLKRMFGVRFSADDESSFIEMKARRDELEHHGGVIAAIYPEKAKAASRYNVGDQIQLSDGDVDEAYQLIRRLVDEVARFAMAAC
jgi:hypothetical protein